jgi:hypothetical protein
VENRRSSAFYQIGAAKAQKHATLTRLESEKAGVRAAVAAERAAEAAEDTARAAKDTALYMLISVIVLALSSISTLIIAVVKK